MRLLLDTQLLIWTAAFPRKLSRRAVELIGDPAHELIFSAVGIWEIAIKRGLVDLDPRLDPLRMRLSLLENGYSELSISGYHAASVRTLPDIHRDPFDRLMVAQAMSEGAFLVTSDARLELYPASVFLV